MKTIITFVLLLIGTVTYSQESHQCGQLTKKGTPCKIMVTGQQYCRFHGGSLKETSTELQGELVQCIAIAKSSGQRCKNKTHNLSGKCTAHQSSNNIVGD